MDSPTPRYRRSHLLPKQKTVVQQIQRITNSKSLRYDKVLKLQVHPTAAKTDEFMKNLPQELIDNPPIKDHKGMALTEFVILGDDNASRDQKFLQQNYITHIVNTCSDSVPNVFQESEQQRFAIRYFSIPDWEEHKVKQLNELEFLASIFKFIEGATSKHESCLLVSTENKCATVVVAIIYMLLKFKWSVAKTLEYICSKKSDVEITKTIVNQLRQLEEQLEQSFRRKDCKLRKDWEIFSNLSKASQEYDLAKSDLRRFNPELNLRSAKIQTLVMVEEEAGIVNSYLNSQKPKDNLMGEFAESSKKPYTSMLSIIKDTLKDTAKRQQDLKRVLHWQPLNLVTKEKEEAEQQKQLLMFARSHNDREKPKLSPQKRKKKMMERIDFMEQQTLQSKKTKIEVQNTLVQRRRKSIAAFGHQPTLFVEDRAKKFEEQERERIPKTPILEKADSLTEEDQDISPRGPPSPGSQIRTQKTQQQASSSHSRNNRLALGNSKKEKRLLLKKSNSDCLDDHAAKDPSSIETPIESSIVKASQENSSIVSTSAGFKSSQLSSISAVNRPLKLKMAQVRLSDGPSGNLAKASQGLVTINQSLTMKKLQDSSERSIIGASDTSSHLTSLGSGRRGFGKDDIKLQINMSEISSQEDQTSDDSPLPPRTNKFSVESSATGTMTSSKLTIQSKSVLKKAAVGGKLQTNKLPSPPLPSPLSPPIVNIKQQASSAHTGSRYTKPQEFNKKIVILPQPKLSANAVGFSSMRNPLPRKQRSRKASESLPKNQLSLTPESKNVSSFKRPVLSSSHAGLRGGETSADPTLKAEQPMKRITLIKTQVPSKRLSYASNPVSARQQQATTPMPSKEPVYSNDFTNLIPSPVSSRLPDLRTPVIHGRGVERSLPPPEPKTPLLAQPKSGLSSAKMIDFSKPDESLQLKAPRLASPKSSKKKTPFSFQLNPLLLEKPAAEKMGARNRMSGLDPGFSAQYLTPAKNIRPLPDMRLPHISQSTSNKRDSGSFSTRNLKIGEQPTDGFSMERASPASSNRGSLSYIKRTNNDPQQPISLSRGVSPQDPYSMEMEKRRLLPSLKKNGAMGSTGGMVRIQNVSIKEGGHHTPLEYLA